ncbi:hypothetical protein [Maribacter halichondriae]|uniref:hypothetical protein n=1 Tax=Maribacter halichondriae TaxID=2980554 RepID=UPI002359D694|nr:hypothetical protein [Maribacter sp. Hal144]
MGRRGDLKLSILVILSIVLTLFLLVGQAFSLINYDFIVSLGLQESIDEVTAVGIAWLKAFALGDTLVYIPLLIMGIIGLLRRKKWGFYAMMSSLAISTYWPVVNLSAIYFGRNDMALDADKYVSFSIILPLISLYGFWGIWYLYKNQNIFIK